MVSLLLVALGSFDGGWRATCGLPADGGLPDGAVCFGDDVCRSVQQLADRSITCRWNPVIGGLTERIVAWPARDTETREAWNVDGSPSSMEFVEHRRTISSRAWYRSGVEASSFDEDGGTRFNWGDGCLAATSQTLGQAVVQYELSSTACDGGVGDLRQLRLPHGLARVSVINTTTSRPTVTGPSGASLHFTTSSVCLGQRCVTYPPRARGEVVNVFWARANTWALVRSRAWVSSGLSSRHFAEAVDPPDVLVDLTKQTLATGHFPLGRELVAPLVRTPCAKGALALQLGKDEWLCLTETLAVRRRGAKEERCEAATPVRFLEAVSGSPWPFATCTAAEALLFRWRPGPFARAGSPECERVFAGVSAKVPGGAVNWDLP